VLHQKRGNLALRVKPDAKTRHTNQTGAINAPRRGNCFMIVVEDVHKHFGGFHAVDGATLTIEKGSITGLIGPNGAGKTTLFNVIAGVLPPTSGRVTMDGEDITGLPPHELFHKGLLRTFQIAHEFHSMTCRENLMMVPGGQSGEALWNTWFGRKRIADEERALRAKADEVLEFLTISHIADLKAGEISGGQKKLLELGRTMMVDAKIVFLDEVGAGVNRTLLYTIADAIKQLNEERGYTFVVIEHDMDFIERLCNPVICMAEGKVLAEGTLAEIKANEQVIEAYLGTGLKNRDKVGA
jgi:branched-chain amino acid transport system ATP-binding protein